MNYTGQCWTHIKGHIKMGKRFRSQEAKKFLENETELMKIPHFVIKQNNKSPLEP